MPDDAGFAVVMAILFILLLSTFSLVVLGQLTQEVRETEFARKHEQTLNTALAGLDGAAHRIRNAVNSSSGSGIYGLLPCTPGTAYGVISGVSAAPDDTWSTTVYYLTANPEVMSPTQVVSNALPCPLASAPSYAYLVSAGAQPALPGRPAAQGNRTLHAIYDFTTTNARDVGGQVVYGGRCWDAGASPVVGTVPTFQTCGAAGTPSQSWYYRPDLSIRWNGDPARNLCLDYRGSASPRVMTLQTCIGSGTAGTAYDPTTNAYPRAGQQYQEFATNRVWNDVGADGDWSTGCINSLSSGGAYGAGAVGDRLVMAPASSCGGAAEALPTAAVAAGGAGGVTSGLPGPTEQLVTFAYFSRCLDVKDSIPSHGFITYPCHQAPNPVQVEGNQRFQYEGPAGAAGPITSTRTDATDPARNYATHCFEAGTTAVALVPCVDGKAEQQWTMSGYVPGDYAQSYRIRDHLGRCLRASSPGGLLGGVVLAVCTGDADQKWNAPPGGTQSLLRGIGER